jgi:hypothetical protein
MAAALVAVSLAAAMKTRAKAAMVEVMTVIAALATMHVAALVMKLQGLECQTVLKVR